MLEQLQKSIDAAVEKRENGFPAEAREKLTEIIRLAEGALAEEDIIWCGSSPDEVYKIVFVIAQALGHRIVCHEHLRTYASQDERETLNRLIRRDIKLGMKLSLPEHQKAVFYYREAKFWLQNGEASWAHLPLILAYQMVTKGAHEEAEYLSLMAEFDIRTHGQNDALRHLERALVLLKQDTEIEPWHRLILESSIYGRRWHAAKMSGEYLRAFRWGLWGYLQAWWLLLYYQKPQRIRAFHFGK